MERITLDEVEDYDYVAFKHGPYKYKIIKTDKGFIPLCKGYVYKEADNYHYCSTIRDTLKYYKSGIIKAKWFAMEEDRDQWVNS